MKSRINAFVSKARDRRTLLRRRLEDIFNREVFSTLLVLSPAWKATELLLLGETAQAARFAALTLLGVTVAVHWHRLAQAASEAADAVEGATEE